MKAPDRWLLPALLGLAALLTIATAGWGDLYNETDGQYGGAAKIMAGGGSWLVPENNGVPRLVKPPLLYWAMASSMGIFGVTPFAARLPDAIATAFWVFITFLIGKNMGGPWRGFLAGAILLSSLGIFTLGRIVMPEPLFASLIAASLYCVLRGREEDASRSWWYLGFWLCASLASFSKGWHGLIYPAAIVALAALLCPRDRQSLRGLVSWQGFLIFSIINLPWYFYIESKFPGYVHNLFVAEQLGHVTGSSAPATDYTSVPRWQFLLLHIAWFFPWSVLVITALFRARWLRPVSFPAMLSISWAVVILASVLLAGQRQDYYAMSMWPALALGAAWLLENRSHRIPAVLLSLLLGGGFLASLAIPLVATGKTAATAERSTAWNTVTNFDASVWQSLHVTALLALGGATICCLAAAFFQDRRQIYAMLAAASCLALGAISGTSIVAPFFSLAKAAPFITAAASEKTRLVYDGGIDTGSSLLFYTDLPVTLLNQKPEEDFIVRKFGIGRDLFLNTPELAELWKSGAPVIFVTESAKLPEWEEVLGKPLSPAARCGTQIILKN